MMTKLSLILSSSSSLKYSEKTWRRTTFVIHCNIQGVQLILYIWWTLVLVSIPGRFCTRRRKPGRRSHFSWMSPPLIWSVKNTSLKSYENMHISVNLNSLFHLSAAFWNWLLQASHCNICSLTLPILISLFWSDGSVPYRLENNEIKMGHN